MSTAQHYAAEAAEIAALVMLLLADVQWSVYQPWWKDPIGRNFVAKDAALFLTLLFVIVGTFLPLSLAEQEWLGWLSIAFVAAIPVILAQRMVVWYRIAPGRGRSKKNDSER